MKFDRDFYLRDTFEVAKNLLGSVLHSNIGNKYTSGKIVELEVYLGITDKASHAYRGRRTKRTEAQYSKGGVSYIFLVYGIHSQFCVVTADADIPHAILIRALEPVQGIEIMKSRRGTETLLNLASGPGKLCQAMGITRKQNGIDLTGNTINISPPVNRILEDNIVYAKRVGIDYAEDFRDKQWRLYIKDNPHVSKKVSEIRLDNNREIL